MGTDFLKLVVNRKGKPSTRYAGEPLECKCGSRATVEVRLDRRLKNGKITPGQKQLRCAVCGAVVWG